MPEVCGGSRCLFGLSGGFQLFDGGHPFQYFFGFHRPFFIISAPLVLGDGRPGSKADFSMRASVQDYGRRGIASAFANQPLIRSTGFSPEFAIFTYTLNSYFMPNTFAKKLRESSSAMPNLLATFGEKIAKLALDFAQATPLSL